MSSSLVLFVVLFQNSYGIHVLIDKSNAEYFSNIILVGNCNDALSVYNVCVYLLLVMPLPSKR